MPVQELAAMPVPGGIWSSQKSCRFCHGGGHEFSDARAWHVVWSFPRPPSLGFFRWFPNRSMNH